MIIVIIYYMIKIIKGKYKNLSMRVTDNGDLLIKAPRHLSDTKIQEFITSKQSWINKQKQKIETINKFKSKYDFKNNVYLFNQAYNLQQDKKEFYTKAFQSKIFPLVEQLSKECNLSYTKLSITNSKRIWGSLDQKKRMKLNWKIVILPIELATYIIIHELCHGRQFDHSKRFWALVEGYLPNYKQLKLKLKDFSFLLTTNVL